MKKIRVGLLMLAVCVLFTGCKKNEIAKQYTVTFNTDGGSVVEKQTIEKGKTATEPAKPTKENYTFEGWYLDDAEFDFATAIEKNIELVAKWTKAVNSEVKTTTKANDEFTLSKTNVSLSVGKSTTIKVTTDSKKTVSWKSSNENVATVKNGKITAKSAGSANITVTIGSTSKTIKVTVTKVKETTTTTTTTTTKTTTTTTVATTTKNPDQTKLDNALASISTKTINKAGTSLNYSYEGCTIENTSNKASNSKTEISGSTVTKLYRATSNTSITSNYKVTCGSKTSTKEVKHNIPASTYTYTVTDSGWMIYLRISGASNYTLNNVLEDINGEVQYPDHKTGNVYEMVFKNDNNTTYAVRAA